MELDVRSEIIRNLLEAGTTESEHRARPHIHSVGLVINIQLNGIVYPKRTLTAIVKHRSIYLLYLLYSCRIWAFEVSVPHPSLSPNP